MNHFLSISMAAVLSLGCFNSVQVAPTTTNPTEPSMSFHQLSATDINGKPFDMAQLKGKKVMVVNTASECGYTPQYKQLQELYEAYKDKGLVIIGFPCNDFGGQEPGSEADIAQFCQKNYGVSFPMMSKVHTKGAEQHPVYQWLTSKAQNGVMDSAVKWNFHKFLVDEEGRLVKSLGSGVGPFDEEVIGWLK
ncbi:MAG: glutathione peroxidase [Flavobacteriales bacterium]|jgi:glutathione peroxidase